MRFNILFVFFVPYVLNSQIHSDYYPINKDYWTKIEFVRLPQKEINKDGLILYTLNKAYLDSFTISISSYIIENTRIKQNLDKTCWYNNPNYYKNYRDSIIDVTYETEIPFKYIQIKIEGQILADIYEKRNWFSRCYIGRNLNRIEPVYKYNISFRLDIDPSSSNLSKCIIPNTLNLIIDNIIDTTNHLNVNQFPISVRKLCLNFEDNLIREHKLTDRINFNEIYYKVLRDKNILIYMPVKIGETF